MMADINTTYAIGYFGAVCVVVLVVWVWKGPPAL